MPFRFWREMTSGALAACDGAGSVAVLPLAATEQHGPHLPTGTDIFIAEGLIAEAARRAPDALPVLVLPILAVGASLEHARFPGTLSLGGTQTIDLIVALGAGVASAGFSKLVLVSSHGGNVAAMQTAALELRARHGLLAVTLTFLRLGLPEGAVAEEERVLGVHGGLIETALMLHFRPDLVDMAKAADVPSLQAELARHYRHLRAYGAIGFGWLAGDLHASGVVGGAILATAELGARIAAHQAETFIELLAEIAEVDAAALLGAS